MKQFFYKAFFVAIVVAGLFVGMFRGQEVRQKWVSRMKNKHEEKKSRQQQDQLAEVNLDEIELATYHS